MQITKISNLSPAYIQKQNKTKNNQIDYKSSNSICNLQTALALKSLTFTSAHVHNKMAIAKIEDSFEQGQIPEEKIEEIFSKGYDFLKNPCANFSKAPLVKMKEKGIKSAKLGDKIFKHAGDGVFEIYKKIEKTNEEVLVNKAKIFWDENTNCYKLDYVDEITTRKTNRYIYSNTEFNTLEAVLSSFKEYEDGSYTAREAFSFYQRRHHFSYLLLRKISQIQRQ